MSLLPEIQRIQQLRNQSSNLAKSAEVLFQQLQEDILKGASTEDPLRDFAIAHLGTLTFEARTPYIELRARSAKDKQILLIKTYEEILTSPKSFYRPEDLDQRVIYQLGTLQGKPQFNIPKGTITLPIPFYVEKEGRFSGEWQLHQGPLTLPKSDSIHLGKKVIKKADLITKSQLQTGIEFYIRAEVKSHFTHGDWTNPVYLEALTLLNTPYLSNV